MLALYGHPFSSYTQKVLIALYENGTPFELLNLDPTEPVSHSADWLRHWPRPSFRCWWTMTTRWWKAAS